MLIPVTSSLSSLLSWSARHCSGTGDCCSFGYGVRIRWSSRIGCSTRIGRCCGPGGGWGTRTTWCTCHADHRRGNMGHTITQPEFSVSIVTPAVRNPIGSESTRVTCACIDVDKRGSCGCHRQHWDEPISGSTVTNLPIILPPTVGDTATGQGTGVTPARANAAKRNSRR